MGAFFPLDSNPMAYFKKCNKNGKMQQNPSYRENLGNWYSYFYHSMDAFFPLDSHPMVYLMGNASVFSSISNNTGKGSQTYRMEKAWKIGSR